VPCRLRLSLALPCNDLLPLQYRLQPRLVSAWPVAFLHVLLQLMGQTPCFDQDDWLRPPSEDSLPSLAAEGFATIQQEDLRFFPSREGTELSSSPSTHSLPANLPGHISSERPQPRSLDIRPRFMYLAGLSHQLAYRLEHFRLPLPGQHLVDCLYGTQPCSLVLIFLESQSWSALTLCCGLCHDRVAFIALRTAMPLAFQA